VIGLITFSVQRIVPKNDAGNNLIAAMARKLEEPSGTLKGKSEIRPLESGTTGAPASSVEKIGSQARRSAALPAAKHPSGGSLPKRQNLTVENIPAPGQVTKESVHNVSGAMSHPVRPTQSQSIGSVPTTLPQLETIIASPMDPVSGLPRDAFPVELKKKESSPPPTKLPEGPVNITGLVAIRTDPYPSLRIPAKRGSKKTHQGMSLQFGHLISRVEPVYPDEAKQNGIEGTVKLHAVIGRNGSVESLMSVDGPPLLVPVTMGAVRQWRFTETLLGGQSVETEEDVAVTFRLSKSGESKR
jgi:outer membrane biosynthesis protein TonB